MDQNRPFHRSTTMKQRSPHRSPVHAISISPANREFLIKAVLFFAFYWTVINIVYTAAASVDDVDQGIKSLAEAADGNIYKKLAVSFTAVTTLALIGWRKMLKSVSIPYILALAWFGCSASWAIDPGISIRRWLSLVMTLVTVTACLEELGTKKSLQVVYAFLTVLLIGSFVSVIMAYAKVPLFSFALHPLDEADPTLIGAWRGPMMHKNVAGAIMTHAAIFFLHFALNRKRVFDWVLFAASLIFIIGTHSKTSISLAGFVLMISLLYRTCALRRGGMQVFNLGLAFVLLAGTVIALCLQDTLARIFSDPAEISGRIGIWMSLLDYLHSHWLLGAGYGSFWAIGFKSPIFQYAVKPFMLQIGHSHSGYFEILVTGGIIGLALSLFALVFWPLYRFLTVQVQDAGVYAVCFGMWIFGVLQNFTESQFFAPDKQSWLFILIAITLVNQIAIRRSKERDARLEARHALVKRAGNIHRAVVSN